MTILAMLTAGALMLMAGGWAYSRYISRRIGEDPARATPAVSRADGRDYVASPTAVVFAHHFAAIAGAGPIVGPVVAIVYGWAPAVLWVVLGGLLVGGVHDYLAAHMSTREGGESVATIARQVLGNGPFLAMVLFLVIMLTLVCAMFLNLSARALASTVPMSQLRMTEAGAFRVDAATSSVLVDGVSTPISKVPGDWRRYPLDASGANIVVGGIASTSVIVITLFAPLIGWLYLKRRWRVWVCSLLAMGICAVSIATGLFMPVSLSGDTWRLALSAYVLLAAGVPVWLLLQSRDFINVHILYVGMGALVVVLVLAGLTGAQLAQPDQTFTLAMKGGGSVTMERTVPAFNTAQGQEVVCRELKIPNIGIPVWPMMFILIACGAVSGFHSLCAGGTTSKQLRNERATRRVGYWAMLLESFVALCVIGVCMVGADMEHHLRMVYGNVFDWSGGQSQATALYRAESNPVLAFAIATGLVAHLALAKVGLNVPVIVGTLGGMVLLEGFLVTTLDAAVRLMRYLLEEMWRMLFGRYDVFARPVAALRQDAARRFATGENAPAGSDGIPIAPDWGPESPAGPPKATRGLARAALEFLRHYWVNSGIAVGLMLLFALTGGVLALWHIFATANQLLAAMVLSLAALWLLRQRRKLWFALAPAVLMLATTGTSLVLLLLGYVRSPAANVPLLCADLVLMGLTAYLLLAGVGRAVSEIRRRARGLPAPQTAAK